MTEVMLIWSDVGGEYLEELLTLFDWGVEG